MRSFENDVFNTNANIGVGMKVKILFSKGFIVKCKRIYCVQKVSSLYNNCYLDSGVKLVSIIIICKI